MIKWRFNTLSHYFCLACAIAGCGCNKDFKTQLKFPKVDRDTRQGAPALNNCISFEPQTNLRQNKCLLYQPPFFPLFWRKCSKDIRRIKHSRQRKPAFLWASNFFNNILNETFDKGIVLLSCHRHRRADKGETNQQQHSTSFSPSAHPTFYLFPVSFYLAPVEFLDFEATAASSRNRAIGFPCNGMEIWPRRSEFHARNAWKSDQVHGIPTNKRKQQFLNFHLLPRNQF